MSGTANWDSIAVLTDHAKILPRKQGFATQIIAPIDTKFQYRDALRNKRSGMGRAA